LSANGWGHSAAIWTHADRKENAVPELMDGTGAPSSSVRVWFAPNTTQMTVPRSKNEEQ